MKFPGHRHINTRQNPLYRSRICLLLLALFLLSGCYGPSPAKIAVIPRTTGAMMWEPEHGGVLNAALASGAHIYWNAPTREDDIQGQIAMVERVTDADYQGLILAPDHSLALITPVRRALSRGIATVVIGSPLAIPAGGQLSYILNDEEAGGRMAAQRIAGILNGHGTVAVLGIDPGISGIVNRARSLELFLMEHSPNIHIVANEFGSFNAPHEQQVADETLKAHPDVDVVVALTSTAADGVLLAIRSNPKIHARVVVFDPSTLTCDCPSVDSFILQNTREMGAEAVRLILAHLQGRPMPAVTRLEPLLVTRENANTPEVQKFVSMDWQPAPERWKWRIHP